VDWRIANNSVRYWLNLDTYRLDIRSHRLLLNQSPTTNIQLRSSTPINSSHKILPKLWSTRSPKRHLLPKLRKTIANIKPNFPFLFKKIFAFRAYYQLVICLCKSKKIKRKKSRQCFLRDSFALVLWFLVCAFFVERVVFDC
jgi:hypothetical protein